LTPGNFSGIFQSFDQDVGKVSKGHQQVLPVRLLSVISCPFGFIDEHLEAGLASRLAGSSIVIELDSVAPDDNLWTMSS
jgi:hypothetical protein